MPKPTYKFWVTFAWKDSEKNINSYHAVFVRAKDRLEALSLAIEEQRLKKYQVWAWNVVGASDFEEGE